MAPSCFLDLGKKAAEVFTKGYNSGLLKIDLKTKTKTGVELSTGGNSNQDTGMVMGSLELKYKFPESNVAFTERITTDNKMFTEIMAGDCLVDGLKTAANVTFNPPTGEAKGQIKTVFTHEKACLSSDFDVNIDKPVINSGFVLSHQGWFLGYQALFDVKEISVSKNYFALGFQQSDFVFYTAITDDQFFKGSLYQRITPAIESAVQVSWKQDSKETEFGIGATYILDQDVTLRAKIDNKCMVGIGYQQNLRPGINLSLSFLFNGLNFAEGGHKIGLGLEFQF